MRGFLIVACFALPGMATADAYVNGPKGCAFLDGFDDHGPVYTVDEDHLVLTADSLDGIEWHCGFASPFDPVAAVGDVQIRAGYCMEPGPFVDPGVFTLFDRGDGTVQLDASGWNDPLILQICGTP